MKSHAKAITVILIALFPVLLMSGCGGGGGEKSNTPDVVISESGGSTDLFEGSDTSDSYTVTLATLPSEDVIITITPDSQTTVDSNTLTFLVGETTKTVTVSAVNDSDVEGTHTSSITHSVSSLDPDYDGLQVRSVTAHISDNDGVVTITETAGSTNIFEGDPSGDTYEVVLASQPTASVTVSIQPDSQSTVNPPSLIFTPVNWDSPRTVTVTAVDDGTLEGSHSSTINHHSTSADLAFNGSFINDVIAAIIDNDRFVYVTNVVSDILPGSISAYTVDPTTGDLKEITGSPFPAGGHPNWVAADPSGKFLYVVNSRSNDLSIYRIDATTGELQEITSPPPPSLQYPFGITIHPSGNFAYVTERPAALPSRVRSYMINPVNGSLSEIPGSTVSAGDDSRESAVDPFGRFLYVANAESDTISGYSIDQTTGKLTPTIPATFSTGGTHPTSVTVDHSGQFVYATNFFSDRVSGFSINASTGALTPTTPPTFPTGTQPRSVTTSPSGHLYAINLGFPPSPGSVSAYSIDNVTGVLTPVAGSPFPAGIEPRQADVDATGTFLYAVNHDSEDVSAYEINGNGSLTPTIPPAFPAGIRALSITTIGVVP